MRRARVIRKSPHLRSAPEMRDDNVVGNIPYFSYVDVKRIIAPVPGIKEWAELGGKYDGLYTAIYYPTKNWLRRMVNTTHLELDPPDPKYLRVLHDFEVRGIDRITFTYKERREQVPEHLQMDGVPETVKLWSPKGWVKLTQPLQEFWFALMKQSAPNLPDSEIRKAFKKVTSDHKCYTNKVGSIWGRDYINRRNLGKLNPYILFEPIITGGNIVQSAGEPFRIGKRGWFHPILTINASDAYLDGILQMGLPSSNNPNPFVHWATISKRDKWPDGSVRYNKVNPFWDLGGSGVPAPNFAPNSYWLGIPVERVVEVSPPFESPYNM